MAKYIDLEKIVFDLAPVAYLPPDPVVIAREFVRQLKAQQEVIPDKRLFQKKILHTARSYYCPSCGLDLFRFQCDTGSLVDFCPRCGQAFDWGKAYEE